jgi:hypothetical protein
MPSRSTAWINEAGTPLRLANPPARGARPRAPAARRRDRDREIGVGRVQPVTQHALDGRERETTASQLANLADPFDVALVVPGDPALPRGSRNETSGLVVADRVDRDVTSGRELLDAIPHDR